MQESTEDRLATRIEEMSDAEGRYTFALWSATEMRADEQAVFVDPSGVARMMIRAEIERHVRLRGYRGRTFAVCETRDSATEAASRASDAPAPRRKTRGRVRL